MCSRSVLHPPLFTVVKRESKAPLQRRLSSRVLWLSAMVLYWSCSITFYLPRQSEYVSVNHRSTSDSYCIGCTQPVPLVTERLEGSDKSNGMVYDQ